MHSIRTITWILLAASFALALPGELSAQGQGRGRGRGEHRRDADVRVEPGRGDRDRDRDRDRGRDEDEDQFRGRTVIRIDDLDDLDDLDDDEVIVIRERDRTVAVQRRDVQRRFRPSRANGNGPAFCRSGEGHPVWGREWCLEKGFGLGGGRRIVFEDDRVFFPVGNDVVIARVVEIQDDRSWVERVVDRVLFWVD